jgi:phosphatidylserine/phosphatidylglycerophosphate/cardiolipin synthase-like enzyme
MGSANINDRSMLGDRDSEVYPLLYLFVSPLLRSPFGLRILITDIAE